MVEKHVPEWLTLANPVGQVIVVSGAFIVVAFALCFLKLKRNITRIQEGEIPILSVYTVFLFWSIFGGIPFIGSILFIWKYSNIGIWPELVGLSSGILIGLILMTFLTIKIFIPYEEEIYKRIGWYKLAKKRTLKEKREYTEQMKKMNRVQIIAWAIFMLIFTFHPARILKEFSALTNLVIWGFFVGVLFYLGVYLFIGGLGRDKILKQKREELQNSGE